MIEKVYREGELDASADDLVRAYTGAEPEIVDDRASKHLDFLHTRVDLG